MTKAKFEKFLTEQIELGNKLLDEFKKLTELESKQSSITPYDENDQSRLKGELSIWEKRVKTILQTYFKDSNPELIDEFKITDFSRCFDFKLCGVNAIEDNITTLKSYIDRLPYLEDNGNTSDPADTSIYRPYKVFISHSHKDKEFAEALVELLEFIGLGKDQLVCTSVPGYGIPSGKNIFDWLRDQFNEYRLFMIFIHSASYYESPVSLNEMGAAWVLKEDFHSFLVKDLDFKDMQGVIADEYVSTKVDAAEARGHLNELKDKLVKIFNLGGVDSTRWETKRDEFLLRASSMPNPESQRNIKRDTENMDTNFALPARKSSDNKPKNERSEFRVSYLPILSKFFDLLDVKDYPQWMYEWACSGSPWIWIEKYENIRGSYGTLCRINRKEGFEGINNTLRVLTQFLKGYLYVCDLYGSERKDGTYVIDRFYNAIPNNPQYDYQLKEYMEYCFLIQDLSYELTRMLNLLLDDIREYVPNFLNEYGIMTVKDEKPEDVKYRNNEASLSPYPGLRQFAESTRFTRSKFIGKQGDIEYLRPILDTYKD